MDKKTYNKIMMDNFAKIEKFVKDNYTDVFPSNVVFPIRRDAFSWTTFAVTTDGYAILGRGSHYGADDTPGTFIVGGVVRTQSPGSMADHFRISDDTGAKAMTKEHLDNISFPSEEIELLFIRWVDIKGKLSTKKYNMEKMMNFQA